MFDYSLFLYYSQSRGCYSNVLISTVPQSKPAFFEFFPDGSDVAKQYEEVIAYSRRNGVYLFYVDGSVLDISDEVSMGVASEASVRVPYIDTDDGRRIIDHSRITPDVFLKRLKKYLVLWRRSCTNLRRAHT